jgi:hypothetical protein
MPNAAPHRRPLRRLGSGRRALGAAILRVIDRARSSHVS